MIPGILVARMARWEPEGRRDDIRRDVASYRYICEWRIKLVTVNTEIFPKRMVYVVVYISSGCR